MRTLKSIISNQAGQGVVEAVLIVAALFFIASFAAREIRSTEMISNTVKGPWLALSGMISYGIWSPPSNAASKHPLNGNRFATVQGTKP